MATYVHNYKDNATKPAQYLTLISHFKVKP